MVRSAADTTSPELQQPGTSTPCSMLHPQFCLLFIRPYAASPFCLFFISFCSFLALGLKNDLILRAPPR